MSITTLELELTANWAKRRGHTITEHEAFALAEFCEARTNCVSHDGLDMVWRERSAKSQAPAAPTAPTVEDKQNVRTLLTMVPCSYGSTARFGRVTANENLVSARLREGNLAATIENFREIFPKIVDKLAISSEWSGAFHRFFTAQAQFASGEANIGILENGLRGLDVTYANLIDLALDRGNPDFVGDKLALSAFGVQQQSNERQQKADAFEKKEIIESLTSGLTDENGKPLAHIARGMRSPRQVYASEVARLESLPLESLRELAARQAEDRRLRSLSAVQAREETQKNFAAQQAQQVQQYQPITPQYKAPGTGEYKDWSKRLWISLSPNDMRRCLKLYGPEQINKACGLS